MKILLITTKHCEACNIAEKNIKQAMSQSSKKITLEIKDIAEMDKKFLKDNKITDFPTVVYIKDDVIKFKRTGTYPSIMFLRWIDIHFK